MIIKRKSPTMRHVSRTHRVVLDWLFDRINLDPKIRIKYTRRHIEVISLLRPNQTVQREDDGAIQFWTIKFHLRNQFSTVQHWSHDRWKACLAAEGGVKRRFQYCTDNSGAIVYFRALQGHSGSTPIDPSLQDNVVISSAARGDLQGMCLTSGGGLVRVPNLRVCKHLCSRSGTRRAGREN